MPGARQLLNESNAFDAQLMARVRARDPRALRALYDRHSSMVYGLALRIVGDAEQAEDVAQGVFLVLWRQAERFDGDRGAFLGWIVSLARNRAIDRRRELGARRREGGTGAPAGPPPAAPAGHDPNESACAGELRRAIAAALSTLPEGQRAALELAYDGGLACDEIAARLDASPEAVKARIRQAMLGLRDALGGFSSAAPPAEPGE